MGDYTYFKIKGKVKEKYRSKIQEFFDYPEDRYDTFEELVDRIGFDLFKDFKKGARASSIFFGSSPFRDEYVSDYNKDTGDWHLEFDIKNYSESGKSKNSSQMFIDIIPELFEEGLVYSEQYEYLDTAWIGVLKEGKLVCTNLEEFSKEIAGLSYGGMHG